MEIRKRTDWWCVQNLLPPVKAHPFNPVLPDLSPADLLAANLLRMSDKEFTAFYTDNALIKDNPNQLTSGNPLIDKLEAEFWSEDNDG